jgi:DNA-directed RNA polymerase
VEENEDAILAAGTEPYGEAFSFWSGADKPWQFLAFCREWAQFQAHGWGFVSSLPVSLDGSCNGLQHYSAALRDPVGGAAVNLLPSDTPEDIYQRVADVVIAKVKGYVCPDGSASETITQEDRDMAQRWLDFGIDRKITKRPVMTLPYGSTIFSCRDFIEEAMRDKLAGGAKNVFETESGDGIFQASRWLQPLVWNSIGEVVKAARVGMDWLKKCATLAGSEGLPVVWYTPDGFMVSQAYKERAAKRVKTVLDGQTTYFTLDGNKPTIDKRRQSQGIAPNWVHSMDATAMRMYVVWAKAHGITAHAMVHDSYGTVAADVEAMSQLIREAFIELYTSHDPLAEFRVDVAMMLSDENMEKLPELPEKGDLDVELVRESDFFFA